MPTYPATPHRPTPSRSCTAKRSPIPIVGWKTAAHRRRGPGPSGRTPSPRPISPRFPAGNGSVAGSRSCWRSACSARQRRCAAATSICGATDARTSRCSTGGMASMGQTALPSIRTRSMTRVPPRWTGTIPARTAACSPTAYRKTAASRVCSTCWTSTPAGPARPDPPHPRRRPRLAPRQYGLLLHPLSRAGGSARGRGALPSRSLLPSARRRPGNRSAGLQARGKRVLARRKPLAGRALAHHQRGSDVRPDRPLSSGPRIRGRAGSGCPRPAGVLRGRNCPRPAFHADQPRRADLPAVCGGSRATRARAPGARLCRRGPTPYSRASR